MPYRIGFVGPVHAGKSSAVTSEVRVLNDEWGTVVSPVAASATAGILHAPAAGAAAGNDTADTGKLKNTQAYSASRLPPCLPLPSASRSDFSSAGLAVERHCLGVAVAAGVKTHDVVTLGCFLL